MRQIIKRITGCLVTFGLIMLGINYLNYIVRPVDTDTTYRRIYAFHTLPENSIEVMVYGSSHAFLGVNVKEMYNKYGIGAYNYGTNWEKINTTKLFMKDSFKTQNPKLAVIETVYAGTVLRNRDINAEIFYTTYLGHSEARTTFLKQCFGNDPERWLSYYMPLCAFHDNWVNISKTSFMPLLENPNAIVSIHKRMGYSPNNSVTKVKIPDPSSIKQKKLNNAAITELNEIVAMCKEKGIEILFITVPYQRGFEYSDAMKQFAEKKGCSYLNLFEYIDEIGLDGKTDFKDAGHLNDSGATKVGDFLGKYISEHYQLTDMRTIKGNLWEQ